MADDDAIEAVREAVTAPRPPAPERADFPTEDAFEVAWADWQTEALERADLALDRVAAVVGEGPDAGAAWAPRELAAITLLRTAAHAERDAPGRARTLTDAELGRVERMLQRMDPEITVGSEHGPTGQFWGRAANAHRDLSPGSYEAVEIGTGDPVRLMVGKTASAAFPVTGGGNDTLDELAVVLAASERLSPAETVRRITALVAESGRAVRAQDAPATDMPPAALARMAATLGVRASQLVSRDHPVAVADAAIPAPALGR